MNPSNVGAKIVKLVEEFSALFGTGNATLDVLLLAVLVTGLSVLVSSYAILRNRKASAAGLKDLPFTGGVGGRIERIELNVNQFRTETLRAVESLRGDLGFIKQEVANLRNAQGQAPNPNETNLSDRLRDRDWEGERQRVVDVSVGGDDEGLSLGTEGRSIDERLESPRATADLGAPVDLTAVRPEPLANRLQSSRRTFLQKVKSLFGRQPTIDLATLDELEELLITSDLGVGLASRLISELKAEVANGHQLGEDELLSRLSNRLLEIHNGDSAGRLREAPIPAPDGPSVILVVGVNGVGKTTTVAKLATRWRNSGAKVLMVAADTFRAAAVKQLETWGERINVPVVSGPEGSKPSTVVFDGVSRGKDEGFDAVIIDTAGRLHNKANLMNELSGIRNTIQRHIPSAPHETLLVIDGSTGQNGLAQAREFNGAVPLTGVIVTKLDGTPKGGIVSAIKDELGIPVRFIGVGEGRQDLRPFVPTEFVSALLEGRAA